MHVHGFVNRRILRWPHGFSCKVEISRICYLIILRAINLCTSLRSAGYGTFWVSRIRIRNNFFGPRYDHDGGKF